jgi:hypothetical protein
MAGDPCNRPMGESFTRVLGAVAAAGALPIAVAAGACRAPTQIELRLDTNVACAELGGVTVTVGEGTSAEEKSPAALATTCDAVGLVGTLVVVPSASSDADVTVKVVAGRNFPVEGCTAPEYGPRGDRDRGCIVARRQLRFIPGTPLMLPIVLRSACVGVDCGAGATCVEGVCKPARIGDPSRCTAPDGCSEASLYGDVAPPDAGEAPDAAADAADAAATDTGVRRVFVTSKTYSTNLGGLDGADAKCQAAADAAKLGGTWRAWLGDGVDSPATRFTPAGPYQLLDGTVIAADWAELTSGTIRHAIDRTEKGGAPPAGAGCQGVSTGSPAGAYTSTNVDGTANTNAASCAGWTYVGSTSSNLGWADPLAKDGTWATCGLTGGKVCLWKSSLYCFEDAP